MSVVVVATIKPVPAERAAVVAAYEKAVAAVHQEEGCELYALNENADQLVMIEKWTSAQALEAHGKGEALVELGEALDGKLAGPTEVQVYTARPAGDADKGAL